MMTAPTMFPAYLPDPTVFREAGDGGPLYPTGVVHALFEVDLRCDPEEGVWRLSHPDRLTMCGRRLADLGEGCGPTRLSHARDGRRMFDDGKRRPIATAITCPICVAQLEEQRRG